MPMSVSIKLSRVGALHNPIYRVIVAPTKSKRDGKNLEIIGSYNHKKSTVEIDKERMSYWVKNGAISTTGVKKILEKVKK